MEQVQQQAPSIDNLIESSNQFYQDLLGYKPEKTSLQSIPENQWDEFAIVRGLNSNSSGIYLPRNQTAVVNGESPLSLFHEYFGHGLYCEQNLLGRKLVELEKRLLKEEQEEFQGSQFSLEDLQKFRQGNLTFQELEKFRQENLARYELFAIWTEYLLSGEQGLREDFERKYDSLEKEEKEAIDSVISFSEQYGDLATMYAQGMARKTTPRRVKTLLEEVYGDKIVNNSKLILLVGSKKPFSDIDLFVSSNYLQPIKNNWLDLIVFDEEDFEKRIKLFEIQITHPIIKGDLIAGDRDYLNDKKRQLNQQSITEKAIQYNLMKASENKRLSKDYPLESNEQKVGLSYSQTYLANALALKEGKKLFTKEELIKFSNRASAEGEKPLQIQGGTKNAT